MIKNPGENWDFFYQKSLQKFDKIKYFVYNTLNINFYIII